MTIKFFPLYFRCSCHMSPAAVQTVYAVVPLLLAIFSRISTWTAKRFGRVQVLVLFKVIGISLLISMALLEPWLVKAVVPNLSSADCRPPKHGGAPSHNSKGGSLRAPPEWKVLTIVGIYLLRTSLMNCTYPLNASILMDFTPRHKRARWQSLGSITRMGWCGSAAIGGVLADNFGYSYTFLITAGVQILGMLIQCLLLPIVPRSEKPIETTVTADGAEGTESTAEKGTVAASGSIQ